MSSGGIIFLYIVIAVVILILNGVLASNASNMANDKGYEKRKWFHMCFWLGPIAYIIVAAMPDLEMRKNQVETNKLLTRMLESNKSMPKQQEQKPKEDLSSYLPDL